MTRMIEVHPGVWISAQLALWLPAAGLAAVADLHLGYEAALGRRGAYLPASQQATTLARLHALLDELRPQHLVLLGDLKHSTRGPDTQEQAAVQALLDALTPRVELVLVRGNHDRGIERFAALQIVDQLEVAGWTLAHGDRRIEAARVVVGHEHPAFNVQDDLGAGFRAPCFLVGERSIVLPAFSPYAAGSDVQRPPADGFLSPYTRAEAQRCYVAEAGRLFLVGLVPALPSSAHEKG